MLLHLQNHKDKTHNKSQCIFPEYVGLYAAGRNPATKPAEGKANAKLFLLIYMLRQTGRPRHTNILPLV
jgi:hypothetical protein